MRNLNSGLLVTSASVFHKLILSFCSMFVCVFFFIIGQSNLLKSSVLVIGAGGLGSPALLYLAACGVGMVSYSYLKFIYRYHTIVSI